jgi:spore coat protein SA
LSNESYIAQTAEKSARVVVSGDDVKQDLATTTTGKIYHLLDEAEVFSERNGGAISRWAANVLRDGPEIVVCPSFDDTWGFPENRLYRLANWSRTHSVHPILYRLPWTLQKSIYLAVFRPLLEKLRPGDLLYVHNKPVCAAVLATVSEKLDLRLVLHMHNSLLLRTTRAQRSAMKHLPLVFCSDFLLKEFQAFWPNHAAATCVVYNGADGEKFRVACERSDAEPEIIFTGRLVPYKGVHVLLQAMRILENRGVKARCTIAGGAQFGTSRKTTYIRKLERMKPANTQLVGYRAGEELASLLRQADIFCCPSIWNDPFPLAPLEAMASGLPVVASRTGGIPEALAYGGGSMVPPADPNALADALQSLIQNASFREQKGQEALQSFQKHFLWANVRQQYESFIRNLHPDLNSRRAPAVNFSPTCQNLEASDASRASCA